VTAGRAAWRYECDRGRAAWRYECDRGKGGVKIRCDRWKLARSADVRTRAPSGDHPGGWGALK
jgi:hypothetical protein